MKVSNKIKANIAKSALLLLAFTQVACGKAIFSSSSGGDSKDATTQAVSDLTFIDDSFERDNITTDTVNNIVYGWQGFVLDGSTAVFNFVSNGAGSTIPAAGVYGAAYDGKRFLLMQGRNTGTNVENVQVYSQPYDLSAYASATIDFHYIIFGDATDQTNKPDSLEVQVCKGNINDCGVNADSPNAAGLTSANWVTVFDSTQDGKVWKGLNGQNQQVSDWAAGHIALDLTDTDLVKFPGSFIFKFVAHVHDTPATTTGGGTTGDNGKCCKYNDNGTSYLKYEDDGSAEDNDSSGVEAKHSDSNDNDDDHYDHSKPCHHLDADGKPCHHKHCHHKPCPPKTPCPPTTPTPPTTTPSNQILSGVGVDLVIGTASGAAPAAQ